MDKENVNISEVEAGQRVDKILKDSFQNLSRARLQDLIKSGDITCNGKKTKPSYKVKLGELLEINIPEPIADIPEPQDIPLDIVYEDDDLLVINKAVGMVVHPAAGNWDKTLVNALLFHCGDNLSGIGGVKRPGIVHRLDKDTSGLMIVAKNDKAHQSLSKQLEVRSLTRIYHAIVWGLPNPTSGVIEGNIIRSKTNRKKMTMIDKGGKTAITNYKLIRNLNTKLSLIECKLETGRTHQIRVHMAAKQNWLVGDKLYGRTTSVKSLRKNINTTCLNQEVMDRILVFPRQALHATEIAFVHPSTDEIMNFKSELADDMQELLTIIENGIL